MQGPAQPCELFSLELQGRRLLVRVDMNVPLLEQDGAVTIRDDTRIRACVPGIRRMLSAGASVTLITHLGRPQPGSYDAALSVEPIAQRLGELLGTQVQLKADWMDSITPPPGHVALGENLRFLPGESTNDEALAMRMAAICDVYVNDAFAVSHRMHASVHGVARHAPVALAGPLLTHELTHLKRLLEQPKRPVVAVIGGAKIATKLPVLQRLARFADHILAGGGVANALLNAAGKSTGASPMPEPALSAEIQALLDAAAPDQFVLPQDLVCAPHPDPEALTRICRPGEVSESELALDLGPASIAAHQRLLAEAGTIVWCGPMGMFECTPFAAATRAMATAVCATTAYTVAGGGDTLAALAAFGDPERVNFCSTGGGAFLSYIAGQPMPALATLVHKETASAA